MSINVYTNPGVSCLINGLSQFCLVRFQCAPGARSLHTRCRARNFDRRRAGVPCLMLPPPNRRRP